MPPKRMTANPVRPARYRPGKAVAEDNSTSDEEESGDDDQEREEQPARAPPPKATSFPAAEAKRISNNLQNVDLNQRRKEGEARERARLERERVERERKEREAGFVTESDEDGDLQDEEEEEEDENIIRSRPVTSARIPPQRKPAGTGASASGSQENSEDSSEESSSSEDEKPTLLRPVFISKAKRLNPSTTATTSTPTPSAPPDDLEARRRTQTDALVQEKLELAAAARLAGKKAWDDDDADIEGSVDDTDGLDPELERQQWITRELSRLKRSRTALEEREAEIAEVERRRGLSTQEREREDAAFIARQKEQGEGKAKAGFMARYHHRGAFAGAGAETGDVEGEARARELAERDLMGAQYEGREAIMEALPEYLQVRDVTMVGRKGRTRYKDLKSEDTGRWGEFDRGGKGRGGAFGGDDRFRPDAGGFAGGGATGANAGMVGERKRPYGDERGDVKRPRYDDDRR